jgi:hypothetical protein
VPLQGHRTLDDVQAAIAAAPLNQAARVQAAIALGELTACVRLLGETEAHVGSLRLSLATAQPLAA